MAAALAALRQGAGVVLLEKGKALGRKVLASGGGRCNLGNARIAPGRYHGGDKSFVRAVIEGFEAASFFSELGVPVIEEEDGRLFPRCGRAQAVVGAFGAALNEAGTELRLNAEIEGLDKSGKGLILRLAGGEKLAADSAVLACGGMGYPKLGGGRGGYALAEALGHSVVQVTPALVPLCVKDAWPKRLEGVRVEASLRAELSGRELASARGEVLFTDYGVSGPAVLDVSREAVRAAAKGRVDGVLDLFPERSEGEFLQFLKDRAVRFEKRSLKGFFIGLLPDKMPAVLLEGLGLDSHATVSSLGEAGLNRLCGALKGWRFSVSGPRPWEDAMVSAGGIQTGEVDPRTMESKRAAGVYLAGEMLDVDGDSGGFNLHFAWASGLIAGRAAAGRTP
jgi:hypothetical protein